MAHKRSRLFGFPLANRLVNVMLPPAVMRATEDGGGDWLMQPLVSFLRGSRDRSRLRSTYSLTFFLVPVEGEPLESRAITLHEIKQMTNPGWGFAASPPAARVSKFALSRPLFSYLSRLARANLAGTCRPYRGRAPVNDSRATCGPFTLRQAVERIAFGVGLSVAQGSRGQATPALARGIGNDVLMALGSARVSSVVVVDPDLDSSAVKSTIKTRHPFPGALSSLMEAVAEPIRSPLAGDPEAQKYRLDRPFLSNDMYAAGVLPAKRCLVVVSRRDAQCGSMESALMQAGSVAYMTLGAATAIGTMREMDRRLERLEGADDPLSIARIDAEVAADLGEIYDLDVTRESYREMYRRLRIRLGIARDYKILQDKMQALYRATSTAHEHKAEQRLTWLTAAIVILSALILIGTIVLAGKGG